MTPDQEKMLLRELAISACERLGADLNSDSPTAVQLTPEMSPNAATPDIDIVGYAAFLADQEQGKLLKDRESPGDEWLGEFTYDLENPCLTKLAADEYRRLRDERERLQAEINEVKRQYSLVAEILKSGIDDRLDPSRLLDPECLAVPPILSGSGVNTEEESRLMFAGAPELNEASAKVERQKAIRKERTLSQKEEKLRQKHGPRIAEINQQLDRLCTRGEAGVLSPTAKDRALLAWAFIRFNKQLISDEILHRRARNQLIEARSGRLARLQLDLGDTSHLAQGETSCDVSDEIHATSLDRRPPKTERGPASGIRSDVPHPIPGGVENDGRLSRLTPLDRRLMEVLIQFPSRVKFGELRVVWAKDVSEDAIAKALKRLRDKLPRKDWYFEISEANYEIIWVKKGHFVP
jgi:hypothetical protein